MFDFLIAFDRKLFLILNNDLHNRLLDLATPFVTNLDNWRIPVLLLVLGLIVFGGRRSRWALGLSIVAVAISDQLSSHWLKVVVARTRPCHVVDGVRLLVSCSGSFSFPSSHAANIAAATVALSAFNPRIRLPLFLLAFLVGYSRVYVGVHYPLDVLAGWLLGSAVALGLANLWKAADRRWGLG